MCRSSDAAFDQLSNYHNVRQSGHPEDRKSVSTW